MIQWYHYYLYIKMRLYSHSCREPKLMSDTCCFRAKPRLVWKFRWKILGNCSAYLRPDIKIPVHGTRFSLITHGRFRNRSFRNFFNAGCALIRLFLYKICVRRNDINVQVLSAMEVSKRRCWSWNIDLVHQSVFVQYLQKFDIRVNIAFKSKFNIRDV